MVGSFPRERGYSASVQAVEEQTCGFDVELSELQQANRHGPI
jgi:hypothetical protein